MIEQPEGSDWVRPSSYQNSAPSGPTDGPSRPGRTRSGASRGRGGRPPEPGATRRGDAPAPNPEPGGPSRRDRRLAAERAAAETRAGSGRPRRGSRGSDSRSASSARPEPRTATRAPALPAAPTIYEQPTEPVPVIDVSDVDGGGPRRGRGGNGDRGRGGGGGGGGGRNDGPDAVPRSPWGSNAKVMAVLAVLTVPFLIIAIAIIGPDVLSSGGAATKKTAPTVAGAQYKLFLRPGLTLSQIGDVVATLPGHTKAAFLAAANSGRVRSHYEPPTTNSLEGLLAPDTYFIGPGESDDSILNRLVTRFDALADQVGLNSAATLTPYQTVIVASLVGQESKLQSDSPQVAAVIYNRIKAKMPLQIDATLCYAKGGCPPVPTNADKQHNSPYNTYKIPGLPPTPIASVTPSALQAALQPANVPYIYYVIGDSTGKLVFSTTLSQQQANIRAAKAKGLL